MDTWAQGLRFDILGEGLDPFVKRNRKTQIQCVYESVLGYVNKAGEISDILGPILRQRMDRLILFYKETMEEVGDFFTKHILQDRFCMWTATGTKVLTLDDSSTVKYLQHLQQNADPGNTVLMFGHLGTGA